MARLKAGEVHIWHAHFSAQSAESMLPLLNDEEKRRASRFIDPQRGAQFMIARGWLRRILARYLDVSPQNLTFQYGERGKPFIEGMTLHFNLSHSDDLMALACTNIAPIGLDVERLRPMAEMMTVARDNFSEAEFTRWIALPDAQREKAFYTIWTRKEAYIKATGDGFRLPLKSFDVTFMEDEPEKITRMAGDDATQWTLYSLNINGYIGAVCLRGTIARVLINPDPV